MSAEPKSTGEHGRELRLEAKLACQDYPGEVILIGTVHNESEGALARTLFPLAKAGKIQFLGEGWTAEGLPVLTKALGFSQNLHPIEDANLMLFTAGASLSQTQSRLLQLRDGTGAEWKAALREAKKEANSHRLLVLQSLFMLPQARKSLEENRQNYPLVYQVFTKHQFSKILKQEPLFQGPLSQALTDDLITLTGKEKLNVEFEKQWLELAKVLMQSGYQSADKLMTVPLREKLKSFMDDVVAEGASEKLEGATVELRDIVISSNAGKICDELQKKHLPVVIVVGTRHIPGLKQRIRASKVFGEVPATEINERGMMTTLGIKLATKGMVESEKYLKSRYGK